jgi:2-dehydropantoate 2-reductase
MKIGVFGAGAIGCYVGGRLLAAGEDVTFVGRASVGDTLRDGLSLSDMKSDRVVVPRASFRFEESASALAACSVVLVTVKSAATVSAAAELAPILAKRTVVVSLQNGVRNAERLRAGLPDCVVLGGMVPFNVTRTRDGRFHRGTAGPLVIEDRDGAATELVEAFRRAGMPAHAHPDIAGVLYGKLLFNLNNATNALAGVTLRKQLLDRSYRKVLAAAISEGERVLKAAKIRTVASGRMRPGLAVFALKLPTFFFERAASAMLSIDEEARSSMWDDLEKRRMTEIDELNGEIVRLGEQHGVPTPVNSAIVRCIKAAEAAGQGSPKLSADDILRNVTSAAPRTSSAVG